MPKPFSFDSSKRVDFKNERIKFIELTEKPERKFKIKFIKKETLYKKQSIITHPGNWI